MKKFMYHIPTKIAFGKGQIEKLPEFIQEYGNRVLLLYGGGSIKKIGIYQRAIELFKENSIECWELSGVEPNPQIDTVRKGVDLCKKELIEVVVPIGGGSTIDCAKAIAVGTFYENDPWDIVKDNGLITKALPIVTVLTVAATGSEMDASSVISHKDLCDKAEINSPLLYPKASILDPEYTYSVSSYHTAAGVADIMSHVFEYYFQKDEALDIQRGMMNSVLQTCIQYGPVAVKEPTNEKARANLMWAASWAINGFIACGIDSNWPAHAMEYQLTNHYQVTHGHGMAIIDLSWMKHILDEETLPAFHAYARDVFHIEEENSRKAAELAIEKTKELYENLGLTLTLQSIGATNEDDLEQMAQQVVEEFEIELTKKDVNEIYQSCF